MALNGNGCCWIQERILSRNGCSVFLTPRSRSSAAILPRKSTALSLSSSFQFQGFVVDRKQSSSSMQTAAVRHLVGSVTKTQGLRFAVVVACFNEIVTRQLLEGALDTFRKYSVNEEDIDICCLGPG